MRSSGWWTPSWKSTGERPPESLGLRGPHQPSAVVDHQLMRIDIAGLGPLRAILGVTENAVKLAWLLRRSPVVLPIPGTLSIEHLRENLAALELDLRDADEIAA